MDSGSQFQLGTCNEVSIVQVGRFLGALIRVHSELV